MIQTRNGNLFYFDDLENNVIDINDIAHSLSLQCRWTGHTIFHYSIAQHSSYAYRKAKIKYPDRPMIWLEALVHDASEAFMSDLSRPAKVVCPDYCKLNNAIEVSLARHFNIPEEMSPEVRDIDDALLITEYLQLIDTNPKKMINKTSFPTWHVEPYDFEIREMLPSTAKEIFLADYHEVKGKLIRDSWK